MRKIMAIRDEVNEVERSVLQKERMNLIQSDSREIESERVREFEQCRGLWIEGNILSILMIIVFSLWSRNISTKQSMMLNACLIHMNRNALLLMLQFKGTRRRRQKLVESIPLPIMRMRLKKNDEHEKEEKGRILLANEKVGERR
ncbi:hypothetical protein F3Y22_tig00004810pilonHSYRG00017 [Hibiscus syriacus]|uniref:Uncharacterized protein n=1 Tax=Hibiscus syriacus TaxID=106335 RepID=A0A6A3CGR2_HIBSY|nr:hypothetical protein F3Y22_tig00004810pilonHSYRG00017 [Hibiscus syriacus]